MGLGGGAIVPLLEQHALTVDSPELVALARAHFGLTVPPERTHVEDGRTFLAAHPGRFDLVLWTCSRASACPSRS